MDSSELNETFSREKLAGYSPEMLKKKLLVLGAGALGAAIAQNLSMWGFHQVTWVDPDEYEKSNATRTLDFPWTALRSGRRAFKAKEIARHMCRRLTAAGVDAHGIKARVGFLEELPPDTLRNSDVIISAVDHPRARMNAALLALRYVKPLLMGGFDAQSMAVTVHTFSNTPGTACYVCGLGREPDFAVSDSSCTAVGQRALEAKKLPATPTLAAATAALLTQQLVDALTARFPEGAFTLQANLRGDKDGLLGRRYRAHSTASCQYHVQAERLVIEPKGRTLGSVLRRLEASHASLVLPAPMPVHVIADDGVTLLRMARPPWRCPREIPVDQYDQAPADAYPLSLPTLNLGTARKYDLVNLPAAPWGLAPGAIFFTEQNDTIGLAEWPAQQA